MAFIGNHSPIKLLANMGVGARVSLRRISSPSKDAVMYNKQNYQNFKCIPTKIHKNLLNIITAVQHLLLILYL
jgi:hypothetical protein